MLHRNMKNLTALDIKVSYCVSKIDIAEINCPNDRKHA